MIDSRSKLRGIKTSFLIKKFIRRVDKKIFKLYRSFDNLLDKYIGGYWNWLKDGGILTNIKSDKITLILTPFHILIFFNFAFMFSHFMYGDNLSASIFCLWNTSIFWTYWSF